MRVGAVARVGGLAGRGAAVPVVAAVLVGVLAGCTADEPRVGETTAASPTETAEPTPTPTPTPVADGPMDRSDAGLGITFTNLPQVTGDLRAALDAYTLFEVEYRRSLTGGAVTPELELLAAPPIVEAVRGTVETNAADGDSVAGEIRIDVLDVQGGSGAAVVDVCIDERDVTYTSDSAGTRTGADLGFEPFRLGVAMAQGPTGWTVDSQEEKGSC
ncbi:hypothetical protein Q9R32_14545 [Actinotalea sp. AC32]|nr:hypothetical protein [Actinotalea sp. AC32]